MKLLGKGVSSHFHSFYKEVEARLGWPIHFERNPHKALGDFRFENGIARIRLNADMNMQAMEHNAAHELLHAVQVQEGWPTTAHLTELGDQSGEALVGTELGALVLDLNVEEQLQLASFDKQYSDNRRYINTKKALQNVDVPPLESPRGHIWTLRYAYLCLTQSKTRRVKLRSLYLSKAPDIAKKGEEIITLLNQHGWNNPDQALTSMVAIRQALGLTKEQVIIQVIITGKRF